MTTFQHAIVRTPCPEMIHGITTADLGTPDYSLALKQHSDYVAALRSTGLQVQMLPPDGSYPDSVFVEDVALITPGMAVITSPGAGSRRGEEQGMEAVLKGFFEIIERIYYPGTLEAGDVMMAGNHFFIGLSERTNRNGAGQLIRILEKYGNTGEVVKVEDTLHLKTGVSYLEDDTILVTGELADHPAFNHFRKILVPPDEAYAANAVRVNSMVLLAEGYPKTLRMLEAKGYKLHVLDVSEFRKLDGGLSCLSLRF